MSNNWVEVWAEDISKTGFTVCGKLHNNGSTYDYNPNSGNFRLYVDGSEIYRTTRSFNGSDVTWSSYYNAGESSSSRSYTITAWWDSSGFGYVDNNEASTTVTLSASQYSAKAPTSVSAICSGTIATVSWSHDGSESAYPLSGFSVSKDDFNTSTVVSSSARSATFSGLDINKAYSFKVRANGSAGNSSQVSSNTVYTTPKAPTIDNVYIMALSDSAYNCVVNITNIAVSPSGKIDLQYSKDKSTWYGPGGSTSTVYSLNGTNQAAINNASNTKLDDTLKNILKTKRTQELNGQNQTPLYFRARVYNSDNSVCSAWSTASATADVTSIAKMFVRLPENSSLKNVYFRVSDATTQPNIYFRK